MAIIGGPAIERDGLVFGYDTGYGVADNSSSTRFYQGKPTTNIVPISLSNPLWFNEYSSGRILQSETLFGQPVYEFKSNDGQIYVSPFAFNSYDRSTNNLTLSVYAKNIGTSAASINTYLGGDFGTDSLGESNNKTIPSDNIWRRYSWTRFSAAMTANYLEFRTSSTGVVISCPQLEIGTTVTPLINGTRSSTQSLIDLTKTTNIDVSNVSFDSTGQPTFDGTDDKIELTGFVQTPNPNNFSVEAIVNLSTHNSNTNIGSVIVNNYSSLRGWIFYLKGPSSTLGLRHHYNGTSGAYDIVYGTGINLNQWYHIIGTDDGTTVRLYINGVQVQTGNSSPATNYSGQPLIGQFPGNNAVTNGKIPVTKIYNRALTAQEVQQNYNAYKNRFNL